MNRKCGIACIFLAVLTLFSLRADAAYMPNVITTLENSSGQEIGSSHPSIGTVPSVPLTTTPNPIFAPLPTPQPISRWGTFLEAIGRSSSFITDGINFLSLAPPNKGAVPGQSSVVVAQSPNPSIQCPYTAPVNQTGTTTVITNPGGKAIHVCMISLVSASQQGISVSEGTGSTCGTGTVYWDGGSGGTMQVAANINFGAGGDRIIYPMQVVGDNVCIVQSGAGNVSGHISYGVFQP